MWWASAGESQSAGLTQDDDPVGEDELDRALLLSEDDGRGEGGGEEEDDAGQEGALLTQETAIVGFFRRLTGVVFATLSDAISRVDGEGVRRGGGRGRGLGMGIGECADRGVDAHDGDGGGDGVVVGLGLGEDGVRNVNEEGVVDRGDDDGVEDEVDEQDNGDDDDENKPLLPPQPRDDRKQGAEAEREQETRPLPAAVEITAEDMTQMGLDVWSAADRAFVEELLPLWWGRDAVVRGGRVECCGVRVL